MITFASILIAGISTGAIYALISLGFTLAFNSSGMLNLMQGGFVVLGGLLSYDGVHQWHLPLVVAIAVAAVMVTAIAAAFHVLVLWPNERRLSAENMLLILLGGLILLQGAGQQIWGDFAYSMRPFGSLEQFTVGGLTIPAQVVWIVGLGVLACAVLTLLLSRTHVGKALRAVAQNPA
ncbi:MAG: ABC transporter permease subunit, partial [Trebonia sp.]